MENISNNQAAQKPLRRRGLGKPLTHLPSWLRNKYFISFAAFCAIMLFLDKNDFFTYMGRRRELHNLQASKAYYTKENNALRQQAIDLKHDPATIEKLAREKYLMKRDNEEMFLIPEKHDNGKN